MKAVILIDYLRQDYFNRSQQLDYSNSKTGKHFKSALAKFGFRENIDYYFDFVYSDIPQIKEQTDWGKILSYKVPRPQDKSLVPYYEALKQRIKENRPEVIVTTGPLGTYAVGDQSGSRYRVGVPTDTKVDGIPYYMIPLNSQEAVDFNPNIAYRRNNGLFALSNYKEKGPDAFEKGTYEHVFLSDFDHAKEVLKKAYQAPLVALDTETNSLEARAKGVKVLVFTLSYDGKTGYEIPIDHPDFTDWTEDQKHEIWELIAKIYANNHYKVMHNARYDLTFILTAKPEDVEMTYKHVIDTKIGYYLAIAQDEKESLRLTDLSKEITSLGGYDDPLEDFKTWVMTHLAKATYLKLKEGIKDKQSELDKKSPKYKVDKEAITKEYCLEVSDEVADSIMSSADIGLIEKYHFDMTEVKEKVLMRYIIPQVNQYREQKLHNPIDGNTFNYAWIPLSIMTPYATGDAVATYRCARWEGDYMRNDADDPEYKILHLWLDVYPRIVYGLVRVQHYGINLDTDYMHSLKESYQEEHERLIKAMAESPAGQATVEWKVSQYQKGLAEFNKSKYKLAYDSAGNPKLKELKEGNLAPELVDKYHYYDKLYTKWKESHKATYKGKKLPFPKDIASAGYRDEDIVKLRNAYKDDLKFSGKPADIGYALFHELHAEIPFEKDYFSDAIWKKFHSPDDVLWSDYSVSAKSTLKYVQENGTQEQKEFAEWGIQLSKVDTLRSDFTEKLDRMRSNLDGYIHGNFSETGTATSRLNGTHPTQYWGV